jgi:hypothetical protein
MPVEMRSVSGRYHGCHRGPDCGRHEERSDDSIQQWKRPHREGDSRNITNGLDAAIRIGLDRAANTLRNIGWFEVVSTRGHLE